MQVAVFAKPLWTHWVEVFPSQRGDVAPDPISAHQRKSKPSRPLRQRCSAPASASRATAPCCPRSSPYSTSRTLGRYAGDSAVAGCGATQPTGQATRCRRSLGQTAVKSSMFREDVVGSMSSPSADGAPRHLSVDGMPDRRSLHVASPSPWPIAEMGRGISAPHAHSLPPLGCRRSVAHSIVLDIARPQVPAR